jgi:hypothetical protein
MSIEGAPYKMVTHKQLYGTFFFIADEYVTHSRDAENILGVLSKFGGLFALIMKVFAKPGIFANNNLIFAKFIRTLFLEKVDKKVKTIKFSFSDAFSHIRAKFCKLNRNQ